jgi:P27 family predicted phage terminase small subunit
MSHEQIPEWIESDEEATDCWRRVYPQISAGGPLTQTKINALARYCLTWSQWKKTMDNVGKFGQIIPIKDEKGALIGYKDRPEIARAMRLSSELTKLEHSIGVSKSKKNRGASSQCDLELEREQWRKSRRP